MTNFTDGGIQSVGDEINQPDVSKVGGWDVPTDREKDRRVSEEEFPWDDIRAPDDVKPTAEQDDEGEDECTVYDSEPFPTDIISGVAGEFARLYSAHMEPPIEFFYIAFLTCLGNVLADRLTLASEIQQQPRMYTVLLGESADERKSTAIQKVTKFFEEFLGGSIAESLRECGYYFCVSWGVGSAEGLQKALEEANKTLLGIDELKAFVGKCKTPGSVLLPVVNTLYEKNESDNRTKTTNVVLRDVYLSVLAACTAKTYEEIWDSTFTAIGFTNRLFIVPGRGRKRFSIPRQIPEEKKILVMHLLYGVIHLAEQIRMLPITENARNKYDQWYMNLESSVHTKRLDTYALRLMSLLAVNDFKVEVDEETVDKVLALVNWQLAVRRQYDPIDADTIVAKLEEKVRRHLSIKGPLTERDLRRFTNADKAVIWAFRLAKKNLAVVGDIFFDSANMLCKLSDRDGGDKD